MRIAFVTIVLVAAFPGLANASVDDIDVLFVFPSDHGFTQQQRVALVVRYEDYANDALRRSGIRDRQFRFAPDHGLVLTGLQSSDKTGEALVSYIEDESARMGSSVRGLREDLSNGRGADLVLLAVPVYKSRVTPANPTGVSDSCGISGEVDYSQNPPVAETVPRTFSPNNAETFAFTVIQYTPDRFCNFESTVPHELGHLLLAEHEVSETGSDMNGDRLLPNPRNHAYVDFSQHSIMFSRWEPLGYRDVYSGTSPALTSADADVVEHFLDLAWEPVSRYRPRRPKIRAHTETVRACDHFLVSWLNDGGGPIDSVKYWIKTGTSWSYYRTLSGNTDCVSFTTSDREFRIRAYGPGGSSDYKYANTFCGSPCWPITGPCDEDPPEIPNSPAPSPSMD